jgi:hypothetical protein
MERGVGWDFAPDGALASYFRIDVRSLGARAMRLIAAPNVSATKLSRARSKAPICSDRPSNCYSSIELKSQ